MTKNIMDAINKLLGDANAAEEGKARGVALQAIHDGVNSDLVELLYKTLEDEAEKHNFRTGEIFSSVAYLLAHILYDHTEAEDYYCSVSKAYGDYIHQVGHSLYDKHGPRKHENN